MTSRVDKNTSFVELPSVRCTGAEYVAFLTDRSIWPEGRFITQMVNRIDGEWMPDNLKLEDIDPNAVIDITDQGDVADDSSLRQWGIIEYFSEWKNRQARYYPCGEIKTNG